MIMERDDSQNINIFDYEGLAKELIEYKKITAHLKKKIKAKDRQIHYLFNCIDEISSPNNLENGINRSRNLSDNNNRHETYTQIKKKEKENIQSTSHKDQQSIFKQISIKNIIKIGKQDLRLPSLQKKGHLFEQHAQENLLKQKIIKINPQRLIALKPQEVRKKFEMKYKTPPLQ